MRLPTGAMTKSESTKASPVTTMVGGTWGVPIALRTIDSTTAIFTKLVIMTRMKGKSDRTASRPTMRIGLSANEIPAAGSTFMAARAAYHGELPARWRGGCRRSSSGSGLLPLRLQDLEEAPLPRHRRDRRGHRPLVQLGEHRERPRLRRTDQERLARRL